MSSYGHIISVHSPEEQARAMAPVLGVVDHVTSAGVFVVVPEFSDNHLYGPLPWNHAGTPTAPTAGEYCVIIFLGEGTGRGFVIGWSPTVPWE